MYLTCKSHQLLLLQYAVGDFDREAPGLVCMCLSDGLCPACSLSPKKDNMLPGLMSSTDDSFEVTPG